MFLTRAYLNPRRSGAIRLLGNPQHMHAAVMSAFPPTLGSEERILWRLDTESTHKASLYIVSPYRPDLTHLIEQAGWPKSDLPSWATKPYEPLLNRLKPGEQYTFRLTANPTYAATVTEHGQRGQRRAHTTPEHQINWLLKQSQRAGFAVVPSSAPNPDPATPNPNMRLINRQRLRFSKGRGSTITIYSVTYQGLLEISDETALRATLTQGIGRARAYGCGLLTLAQPTAGRPPLGSAGKKAPRQQNSPSTTNDWDSAARPVRMAQPSSQPS